MKKGKKLYEGKAKIIIFATSVIKILVIQHTLRMMPPHLTIRKKQILLMEKEYLNNRISEHYTYKSLSEIGIKNHLIKTIKYERTA